MTFTADDYATATVTVEVTEAVVQLEPVELEVVPSALEIVGEMSTELTITATPMATITIISGDDGIAFVPVAAAPFILGNGQSTTINVLGARSGTTTLTIKAAADGYTTTTASVEVEVIESLRIEAEPVSVDLVQGASTEIRVRVSRVVGDSVRVDIAATEGLMVASSVTLATRDEVAVAVTATESYNGPATVTFTADDYATATVTVEVTEAVVQLEPVELEVVPSALEIVGEMSTELTITATPMATITIISGDDGIAFVPVAAAPFILGNGQSTTINVLGARSGTTTLTIKAAADGYTTTTASVEVEVIERLRIEAEPVSFDLVQGASTEIRVRVSRVVGDSVRVDIAATEGLMVASSVTLATRDEVTVAVTATESYSGPATVTFTADDYATATVTLEITPAPAIVLSVTPSPLEIVSGMSAELMLTVTPTAMITIRSDSTGIASVAESAAIFLLEGGADNSTTINVFGDRSGTTTLTITARAAGRTETTVSVRVEVVESLQIFARPPSVDLVAGASTQINVSVSRLVGESVTVDIAATTGLSVASSVLLTDLNNEVAVTVTATESYDGTATVTFTATDYAPAQVGVTVITPTLMISASGVDELEIEARKTTDLTVTVSAAGNPTDVTLTATVTRIGIANVVSVTPTEIIVSANTPTMFTVEGLDAGTAMLRLTASHPDYKSTSIDVSVSVYLPGVELSVSPPSLRFEQRATESLTVAVRASTEATITIRSGNANIASVSSQAFTLMGGEINNSTNVVVSGVGIGRTTLAITASADGYATEEVVVIVEVQNRFRIAATPTVLSLVEGASTEISVSLNRIPEGSDSVTVTINLQDGSELTVMPSSLEFTDTEPQNVTVRVTNFGGDYTDIRNETLTLTADDYTTAMVTVEITDDDLQPIELMVVGTIKRNLVRFSTADITVNVDVATGLTVKTEGVVRLEAGAPSTYSLTEDALSQQIQIEAVSIGEGTVTFTVGGTGQVTATAVVTVTVSTPTLMISEVSPSNINLLTQETTVVTVSVSAIGNHDSTLKATVTGTGNSVTPTEIIGVRVGTLVMFRVTAGFDAGNTTLTLTASHPDYDSASTKVDVRVDLRPLGLSVSTSELKITVGTTEALTIQVNAEEATRATLTTSIEISTIISVTAPATPTSLTGGNTIINVTGVNQGETDLVIRVEADGYEAAEITVKVRVIPVAALRFRIKVFLEGAQ